MHLYLILIEKCLKVGFLSIQKFSKDSFPVDTTFVGGCFWLFRSLLLKFGSFTGVGWKVQGLEVKLRRITLVGDPDEAD